jgi:hypothetical protein
MSELLTRVAAAETERRKAAAQRLFAVLERAATQQTPAPDDAEAASECLSVLDWDARGLKGYLERVRRTLAAREARKRIPELDAALKAAFAAKNKTDAD